jgi:hypothetical protein
LEGKTDTAPEGARVVGGRDQWCSCSNTSSDYNTRRHSAGAARSDSKAALEKKDIKAQRVILEAVKDHLIPHVSEKASSKEMYDALVSLFQSDNMSRR